MNPLTLVKRIQNINQKEAALGISEDASWHAKYKDSAYVYVGGIPFDLTEGDLLAVFAQYGEVVDVNLIRDKGTGKSKGFAFIAYEDQRSTNLAVDNLNGAQVLGRVIRVDHVNKYKKLEEEDEETKQQKREERGVCRAFQRGNCNRGDSCKFSHDEQRAANTGWGAEEDRPSTWVKDKYDDSAKNGRAAHSSRSAPEREYKSGTRDSRSSEAKRKEPDSAYTNDRSRPTRNEPNSREEWDRRKDDSSRSSEAKRKEPDSAYTNDRSRPTRNEPNSREEWDRRKDDSSRKYDSESYHRGDKYGKERDNRSYRDRDTSQRRHRRDHDD